MKKLLQLAVIVLVVAFVGFWLQEDPGTLAELTKDGAAKGWDLATDLFSGIIDFTVALFG